MKKNKEKTRKIKFLTGIAFQVAQALIVTGFVLSQLNWSWASVIVQNLDKIGLAAAGIIYNACSWFLIISGLKESDEEED